jgi:lipid II:glycine glycyltransferase (peptidoglycan interpeptide bridge formation enzyme)
VADPLDRTAAVALIDAVVAVAGREGATLVRFEPQWADDADAAGHFAGRGFAPVSQHIMPPRTLLVDLRQELDGIWRSFHSNTRNRIRLAEKLGVTVRVGAADDVATFVRLHDETNARHGLRRERPEQFHAAARLFGPGDGVRLYLAEAEGAVLAGIMVFAWGTAATYLWGASSGSEDARRLHPNQLLHWTAMQWARERGCTTYDLFGIPDYDVDVLEAEYGTRTDRWWNLYRFKRGFGGTVHRHLGTFDGTIQS